MAECLLFLRGVQLPRYCICRVLHTLAEDLREVRALPPRQGCGELGGGEVGLGFGQ